MRLWEDKKGGNEVAIAIGSIIDDIFEAIIVGIALAGGVLIGKAVLLGFFPAFSPYEDRLVMCEKDKQMTLRSTLEIYSDYI
ncbi:MAG: hypothetical protein JSW20_08375 [Nitrospiraceae bacterium]|nr:MAG: hypothetical protein JSW20_08375 [Nitrospiraceae bacterium]